MMRLHHLTAAKCWIGISGRLDASVLQLVAAPSKRTSPVHVFDPRRFREPTPPTNSSDVASSDAQQLPPSRLLPATLDGWVNQHRQHVIDYLQEENRSLLEPLGGRRLRVTVDQRRRLTAKAKWLRRKALDEVASLVTPHILLARQRRLIARKWDYRARLRSAGRSRVIREIVELVIK